MVHTLHELFNLYNIERGVNPEVDQLLKDLGDYKVLHPDWYTQYEETYTLSQIRHGNFKLTNMNYDR